MSQPSEIGPVTGIITRQEHPEAQKKRSTRTGGRFPRSALLVLPGVILVVALLFYPISQILVRSFESGLDDYAWAIGHPQNRQVLLTTLRTAGLVTLLAVLFAYPYAYVLSIAKPVLRTILLIAVMIPVTTSLMIRSFSWVIIFQQNGVLNQFLGFFGIEAEGLLGSTAAVLIGMTHVLMPFAVLPLYAVMARIDKRLVTAARSLGASAVAAFFKVYLPLTLRGIGSGALLVFVLAMGFFITPALLGSPSNTMASVLIQTRIGGLLDFAKGGALAGVLLLLTIIVLVVGALLLRGGPNKGGSRG